MNRLLTSKEIILHPVGIVSSLSLLRKVVSLKSCFNLKYNTEFYHQSNLVYNGKVLIQTCTEEYIRETDRRIKERIIDHNKRDKNSHILKHSSEESHSHIWDKDFKVLGNNYRSLFIYKTIKTIT